MEEAQTKRKNINKNSKNGHETLSYGNSKTQSSQLPSNRIPANVSIYLRSYDFYRASYASTV